LFDFFLSRSNIDKKRSPELPVSLPAAGLIRDESSLFEQVQNIQLPNTQGCASLCESAQNAPFCADFAHFAKTEQRMILKADEERDPDVEIAEEKCYF
jgi:hypothetical protein